MAIQTPLTAQSFYPNKSAKKPALPLVLVMLVVFFPVGIYLLHKRIKISRGLGSAAVVTYTWSIIGIIFSILLIIGELGILAWIMLAVFVFAFLYAIGEGTEWKEYNLYISILMSGEWYLPYIADSVGKEQREVIRDLNDMFSSGIFTGSYINLAALTVETNYSCLAEMGLYAPELKLIQVEDTGYDDYKRVVVRCMGCGANVHGIVGQTATCEFCDAPVCF